MIRYFKLAVVFGVAALSIQATAAAPDAKLWNGTWHLNAAASKWRAGNAEASETRSYDFAKGMLTMKSTAKDSKGKETNFSYSAGCDGKSAPMVGNPNADSISLTCVSGSQIRATSRLKGKVTVQSTATVSGDGKHLTLKRTYVGTKGSPTETLEFGR